MLPQTGCFPPRPVAYGVRYTPLSRKTEFAEDSSLEGTGFELPVRECDESGFAIAVAAREELKVCRLRAGGDWIRTSSTRAREVGCRAPTAAKSNGSTKPLSMRIGDLRSARTPHQGQEGKDIVVLDRWAEDRTEGAVSSPGIGIMKVPAQVPL